MIKGGYDMSRRQHLRGSEDEAVVVRERDLRGRCSSSFSIERECNEAHTINVRDYSSCLGNNKSFGGIPTIVLNLFQFE